MKSNRSRVGIKTLNYDAEVFMFINVLVFNYIFLQKDNLRKCMASSKMILIASYEA